ncbi:putative mitochondrial large ribosomal subunit protein L16 [Xylona heveae TC161]|uniref:Putative mitochondrial large ribosomal subunit protein L16 n=1 Tax=Xylona heveae (strain CBS 132557 / TC161) TaxID=1328760 RepID=A0A165A624_XYLHT|nr:putative mitochondrial large ribosomal subunit protein L16 [Xylona heveae TC161]KZF20002.1 putative mitochondrial large ribosomal subunit protein L16 [Xylona heveae TC161]
MGPTTLSSGLLSRMSGLSIHPSPLRALFPTFPSSSSVRAFSATTRTNNWLQPKAGERKKTRKGRPRVQTGGSTRGTTVVWGEYGLRLLDHHRRISAAQLKNGEETIRKRLRGMKYRLYMRVSANIGVYTKGNEARMGTGKGSFDYWAARVPVSRIIFELKGDLHEQVARDAFRLAGNKLPGLYEFVKKGDPPVMGITKLGEGVTEATLRKPRRKLPLEQTAHRISGTD